MVTALPDNEDEVDRDNGGPSPVIIGRKYSQVNTSATFDQRVGEAMAQGSKC